MSGFVSAHILWNAISNLELRRSYKELRNALVQAAATAHSNICRRVYALTVDAIKKQLLSQNNVSVALDGWTSQNNLTVTSVIAYYIDRDWILSEVQPTFNEVDQLFCCRFEC